MKTSNTLRAFALAAAALAVLVGNSEALAQSQNGKAAVQSRAPAQSSAGLKTGLDAMNNRRPAQDGELPRHAKAQSGVVGDLDARTMSASVVSLSLADGSVIEARLQRVASDAKHGSQSWIGTFDDSPGSVLVLTKWKGVVTGFANYRDQTVEIQPTAGGRYLLYAVDIARLPNREVLDRPQTSAADAPSATSSGYGLGASASAMDPAVHDIMVVYTAASAGRYGQAAIEGMIQSAVQSANQAYQNSQVAITMNLVAIQQVAITEGSSILATKGAVQADPAVARLRDQVGADVVMLVGENSDACGVASLMTTNSTSFAPSAFGAVYSSCLSSQTLAHEVGHNQGLMHDRASSSYGGVYPYSYGYRVCATDGTGFRDVMSYACSGVPRVLLFSSPNVTYNGYAAGVSYESDPANSADNARTLSNTASTVAAFRASKTTSSSTPPAAPSSLVVSSVTYAQVGLAWTDNAANETGYKVERSGDGVVFSEVATLGADTTTFSDGAVSRLAKYYYRVRAFNSAGLSGYSGAINVTTPDVPSPAPAAPTRVDAADNANGSATISWATDTGGAAVSFEVFRETWNTRRSAWGGGITAAAVPGSLLSAVDASGAGTFRYSVRAVNAGGSSAYAGAAQVIVTSTSTSGVKRGGGKPPK